LRFVLSLPALYIIFLVLRAYAIRGWPALMKALRRFLMEPSKR
jgi:hypothetical protein